VNNLYLINMPTKLLFVLLIFSMLACKNSKSDVIYDKYCKPIMSKIGLQNYTGKILTIANNACRKCAFGILKNNYKMKNLPIVLVYDTTVYGNILNKNSFQYSIPIDNDILARVNYPDIFGHRIYFIKDDKIINIKEINATNVDSLPLFLKQ